MSKTEKRVFCWWLNYISKTPYLFPPITGSKRGYKRWAFGFVDWLVSLQGWSITGKRRRKVRAVCKHTTGWVGLFCMTWWNRRNFCKCMCLLCVYVHVCKDISLCISARVYMWICLFVNVPILMCVRTYDRLSKNMCPWMCTSMDVCAHRRACRCRN